jgi:hypothetical protein
MDFVSILQFGAIGLGFLLAFLAYKLLANEQSRDTPRSNIITAIYVFMVFSFLLVILGGSFKALPGVLSYLQAGSPSPVQCKPGECVKPDGTCGLSLLTVGSATYNDPKMGQHANELEFNAPEEGKPKYSKKIENGNKYGYATWNCR